VIVDLVGAPGAGKSHLAPQLAKQYNIPIITVGRLGQRNFYFTLFALANRQLVTEVRREFRRQVAANPELGKARKWRRFMSMGAKLGKARLMGGGLIDEGLFQGILKIFEKPATAAEIERYTQMIGTKPDRVIIVEAGDALRYDRMEQRKDFPRPYLSAETWQHWHDAFTANVATLKPILIERFGAVVVHNDTRPN
jgi:dephospho-CoA kinase